MKVGPLGCLSLLGAASFGWAIGRLPDVLDSVRRDIASATDALQIRLAAAAPSDPDTASAPARAASAPTIALVTLSPAQPRQRPLRQIGERGNPLPPVSEPDDPPQAAFALAPGVDDLAAGAASTAAVPVSLPDLPSGASPPPSPAFALATLAYADLARGDRRAAAANFAAALAADPLAENAAAWRRDLRQLTRRWSSETYVIMRDGGSVGLGTTPVLGGGQGGRSFSYTTAPLASRPLYFVVRTTGARTDGLRLDGEADSEQAAAGIRWQAARGATVSVERLFALTDGGRSAWTVRLAGGGTRRIGQLVADAYGEVAIVGLRRADLVAGVQARVFKPVQRPGLRFETGIGLWSGIQRAGTLVDRIDAGPTISIVTDSLHLRASLDYRFRLVGNAAPGSGPVLTVSRSF